MRALVVEAKTGYALRMADTLMNAGISVIGPARSSGEALMLALREQPDVVVLSADLESVGAGHRLAEKLDTEFNMRCLIANESDVSHCDAPTVCFTPDQAPRVVRMAKELRKSR